jgi:hypothetical protein
MAEDASAAKAELKATSDQGDEPLLADAGKGMVKICLDEFGRLEKPRRIRATFTRPHGVRHMLGAYDVTKDRLYGHVKGRRTGVEFLTFSRYLRSLYPPRESLLGWGCISSSRRSAPHLGDDVRNWQPITTSGSPTPRTTARARRSTAPGLKVGS